MIDLIIYSKPACPFCVKAKKLADSLGMPYIEVNIFEHVQAYHIMKKLGFKTVPQIYLKGVHIGGYDDFVTFVNNIGLTMTPTALSIPDISI